MTWDRMLPVTESCSACSSMASEYSRATVLARKHPKARKASSALPGPRARSAACTEMH